MQLKELQPILRSGIGKIQSAIVYDATENKDLDYGCSVDYAIAHHGEREVSRIYPFYDTTVSENYLVIEVK